MKCFWTGPKSASRARAHVRCTRLEPCRWRGGSGCRRRAIHSVVHKGWGVGTIRAPGNNNDFELNKNKNDTALRRWQEQQESIKDPSISLRN